jgi:hypothetical protein
MVCESSWRMACGLSSRQAETNAFACKIQCMICEIISNQRFEPETFHATTDPHFVYFYNAYKKNERERESSETRNETLCSNLPQGKVNYCLALGSVFMWLILCIKNCHWAS